MASLKVSVYRQYQPSPTNTTRAHATITFNYSTATPTNPPTTVSVTASSVVVSGVSYTGSPTEAFRQSARALLVSALSSMTATLTFGGQTVASKTGLALGATYSVSGTKSVNRGTSATTATVTETCDGKTASASISVPARTSYSVTYNANSGNGAPSTQTKYYGYNLPLSSGRPTKTDYTFLGWATSAARAGTTPPSIDYNPSQTYSGNAALPLYAIWKRNYIKPALNNLKVDRCALKDGDYVLDDEGGYAQVTFQWNVFRTTDALYYGGSDYAYEDNEVAEDGCEITVGSFTVTATPTGQSSTYTAIVGDGSFNTDNAYPVTVSITDTQEVVVDNTTIITGELSKAKFPIDINEDATAIAFLSTAPDDDEGAFFGKNVYAPNFEDENGNTLTGIAQALQTVDSLTYTSPYVTRISVKRWLKVVTITLVNMTNVPAGQNITLFTLPAGWRPPDATMELLRNPNDSVTTARMRATVNADGTVQVYNYGTGATGASSNASCVITYIATQ